MKNIFKIIVLAKIFSIVFIFNSYAASATGAADTYKVTMRKVELCTSSTSVSNCEGSVTIGSGDQTIDISAVDAGAAAGSYGDAALLPLGETYTHLRVTIDRSFIISSSIEVSGVTADCNTTADLSGSSYPGGSLSGTEKYDRSPVEDDGQTQAAATLYLKNDQMKICTAANCASVSAANDIDYSSPSSATYQEGHAEGDTTDDHMLVYKLTNPYTVSLIPPTVDISFGTATAVKATEIGTDLCFMEPLEPVVTLTIK